MTTQVTQQVSQSVATIIRPANTTQYTAGDVIANSATAATVLTFQSALGDAAGAKIRSAMFTSSAIPGTKLNADLFLFHTAPTAYGNDNEAFVLSDADLLNLVAVVSLDGTTAANLKTTDNNYVVINGGLALPVRNTALSNLALYGVLVARNAYTPVSAEVLTIKLGTEPA